MNHYKNPVFAFSLSYSCTLYAIVFTLFYYIFTYNYLLYSYNYLLDNGSALNVCPLATAIALGFAPSDFGPSTQTVRAYDNTKREVMGTLVIDLWISLATFFTLFQVLRIPTSFNLLLGRPWIHKA